MQAYQYDDNGTLRKFGTLEAVQKLFGVNAAVSVVTLDPTILRRETAQGEFIELSTTEISERDSLTAASRLNEVEAEFKRRLYSDVTAQFPSGPAVIQFRNEQDRINLTNVTQGAIAKVVAGEPAATMVYRTADNVIQHLTAAEMMALGMGILADKQAIQSAAWAHKDAIRALIDAGDLDGAIAYDITVGWPV